MVKEAGKDGGVETGLPLVQLQTSCSAETPLDMPDQAGNEIGDSLLPGKTATDTHVTETHEACFQTPARVEVQPDFLAERDDAAPPATDAGGCSSRLLPGTRVRMRRDVCGWFDRRNDYFVDSGWQGSVLTAALPEWDTDWFRPDVHYVYVKFRHPPDEPESGRWWDTLDGQCYYKPRGVKLAVKAADVEILE